MISLRQSFSGRSLLPQGGPGYWGAKKETLALRSRIGLGYYGQIGWDDGCFPGWRCLSNRRGRSLSGRSSGRRPISPEVLITSTSRRKVSAGVCRIISSKCPRSVT